MVVLFVFLLILDFIIPNKRYYTDLFVDSNEYYVSHYIRDYVDSFFMREHQIIEVPGPDIVFSWVNSCPAPLLTPPNATGKTFSSFSARQISPHLALLSAQGSRLAKQISESRQQLLDLRSRTYLFLTASAIIGFFTTVIAASNAWLKIDNVWGSMLKLFGVMLPALGTLAAALSSIYAPVDTISRKAQLVSGLINLQGEFSSMLAMANCTKVRDGDAEFSKTFAEWNKRFSAAMAAAEFSQGTVGQLKEQGENDKGGSAKGSVQSIDEKKI